MATTNEQLVNRALLRIGVTQQVTDLTNENTLPAIAARLVIDDERDFVLRDFPWPRFRKYAAAVLSEGSASDPTNADWIFAYAYPSDCIFVRRIVDCYGRKSCSPPPFALGRLDDGTKVIYTNQSAAEIEYTVQATDPGEFDALFASLVSWRLAAALVAPMAKRPEFAQQALEAYAQERAYAISKAAQEAEFDIASGEADPRVRDIFNLALMRIGISRNAIQADPELTLINLWPRVCFHDERDFVLRDYPWSFAKGYADPLFVTGSSSEPYSNDWIFAFRCPVETVNVRRLVTTKGRKDIPATPFAMGHDPDVLTAETWDSGTAYSEGDVVTLNNKYYQALQDTTTEAVTDTDFWQEIDSRLILTDYDSAITVEMTRRITDPNVWDSAFHSMLAWRLAAVMAPSMAKTEKDPQIVARCMQSYEFERSRAQRMDANEGQDDEPPDADWIRGRDS